MIENSVFIQIADLIARIDPVHLSALRASTELQERLEFLIEKSKEQPLNVKEKDELDHFIVLERLIGLAKIRAN